METTKSGTACLKICTTVKLEFEKRCFISSCVPLSDNLSSRFLFELFFDYYNDSHLMEWRVFKNKRVICKFVEKRRPTIQLCNWDRCVLAIKNDYLLIYNLSPYTKYIYHKLSYPLLNKSALS